MASESIGIDRLFNCESISLRFFVWYLVGNIIDGRKFTAFLCAAIRKKIAENTDGGEDYFRNNRNRSRRNFLLRPEVWKAPEDAVAVISVVGDRYDAEQQRQAGC